MTIWEAALMLWCWFTVIRLTGQCGELRPMRFAALAGE